MTHPRAVRAAFRNDSGSVVIGELTAMVMTGLLLSSVVGIMWLSVRLVRTAPPAHNPTVYGTLVASGGRLGDSLSQPLVCSNPLGEDTRSDCLDLNARQLTPVADPALRHPETAADRQDIGDAAMCWAVSNDRATTVDKRRLECWQRLSSGYLQVWVHNHEEPDDSTPAPDDLLADTSDLLFITNWQTSSNETLSRSVVSGLESVRWQCDGAGCSPGVGVTTVELVVCAAIRPEQRNAMKPGFVPFCDGTIGAVLSDGSHRGRDNPNPPDLNDWGTIEGYLLPPVHVYTSGS